MTAKFQLGEETLDLPLLTGSEQEIGADISKLRSSTGAITFDPG
jgi:citrate synthase